jgi:hypothetical protein
MEVQSYSYRNGLKIVPAFCPLRNLIYSAFHGYLLRRLAIRVSWSLSTVDYKKDLAFWVSWLCADTRMTSVFQNLLTK